MTDPQTTWQPPMTEPPRKRRWPWIVGIVIAAIIGLVVVAAIAAPQPQKHVTSSNSLAAPSAPAAPSSPPAPEASPDGTYQGSCDYILGENLGDYQAVGEIDLTNTGNVGVVVHTRITWPQEGADPITARKTTRLAYGTNKVVRFKIPITQEQIDLLQSWQERHDFKDGCTYHAAFTDVYGAVHG